MNATPTSEAIVMFRSVTIAADGSVKFVLSQLPSPNATRVGVRVTVKQGADEAKVKQFLIQQCAKLGIADAGFTFAHVPSVKYPGYESYSYIAPVIEKGDAFAG